MITVPKLQDLDSFCKMLEFGKFNGKWDVKIDGLGCTYYVSEVEKTAAWLMLSETGAWNDLHMGHFLPFPSNVFQVKDPPRLQMIRHSSSILIRCISVTVMYPPVI